MAHEGTFSVVAPTFRSEPDQRDPELRPRAPTTLEETGLGFDLLRQLTVKVLHSSGETTGIELADRLGLPFAVLTKILEQLLRERHVEPPGGQVPDAATCLYRLTNAGQHEALQALQRCRYVGIAPVPLRQYTDYMTGFVARPRRAISPSRVRTVFSHLVLSDRVLDQLGLAVIAGESIFIYGPPGNGKSAIAMATRRLFEGEMAIPAVLEVEGDIIGLFDPTHHERLSAGQEVSDHHAEPAHDRRWFLCRRPFIVVGSEVTTRALEVTYDPTFRFHRAPIQTMANGGVLVIDNFGRQRASSAELLNRCIAPLEDRVDHLMLNGGKRVTLPFETLVIVATNVRPPQVVDESLLRRIPYKIFAQSPSVEDFARIFQNTCRELGVTFDREPITEMLARYYRPRRIALRGCHPRDLLKHVVSLADYLGRPRELSYDLLEFACEAYFADQDDPAPLYA